MWKVEEAKVDEWVDRMTDRLRNLLRHTQQGRVKTKPPAWVAALALPPWERKASAGGAEEAAEDAAEDEDEAPQEAVAVPLASEARVAPEQAPAEREPEVKFDVATGIVTLRSGHNKSKSY